MWVPTYRNDKPERGCVKILTVSVILSVVEGSTGKTFYNTLTDRPFDYAQGDRDSMNREANIAVKVLADTNNSFMTNGTVPPQSIAAPWWDGNKEGEDESLYLKTFSEILRGATGIPDG